MRERAVDDGTAGPAAWGLRARLADAAERGAEDMSILCLNCVHQQQGVWPKYGNDRLLEILYYLVL